MKHSKPRIKINKKILDQSEGILMLIITIMLVIDVLIGILARFVHFENVFATELGKYLFIWLCLIGISAAAKDNQHIRISFIVEKLPINPKVTWILSQAIFLAFSILMFYVGVRLTWMHFSMSKSAVGFNFPMYVFTAAIPLGFLLTSLRLIKDIIENINRSKSGGWNMNQTTVDKLSVGEHYTIKTESK
jgi:TRAP-type C4-dicarboxylate transport system permease small subunit